MAAGDQIDPLYTTYGAPSVDSEPKGITTPGEELLSAYEPIVFDVTWAGSSETLITNKRVEAKLYYGSTPVLLGTWNKKSITVSGTEVYRFNFHKALQTVLSAEFFSPVTSDTINTGNENIVVPFYIEFTAKFRDRFKWDREDETLTTSTYYAVNGIIREDETNKLFNKGVSDFILGNSSSKFLTRSPNQIIIRPNEDYQLTFLTGESDTHRIAYEQFDSDGNSLGVNTGSLIDCTTSKHGTITVSDNTILSGMPAQTQSRADVWVQNSVGTQISEKFRFDIDYGCQSFYRLWWHNSLGGVDKHTFTSFKSQTYELEDRKNVVYPLNEDVSTTDFQNKTINTSGRKKFKVISDFDYFTLDMFADLINTTEAYLQKDTSSTELLPIIITSTSQPLIDSEGLIQVEINFQLSQNHKSHIS